MSPQFFKCKYVRVLSVHEQFSTEFVADCVWVNLCSSSHLSLLKLRPHSPAPHAYLTGVPCCSSLVPLN